MPTLQRTKIVLLGQHADKPLLQHIEQDLRHVQLQTAVLYLVVPAGTSTEDLTDFLVHKCSVTSDTLCIWADRLLLQIQQASRPPINHELQRHLRRMWSNGGHIAAFEHMNAELLMWCSEQPFFDCLSLGQHAIESHWRIQRCAAYMQLQFANPIRAPQLPNDLEQIPWSRTELRLLQILWANQPTALSKDSICSALHMRTDTRTVLNLISTVNRKLANPRYHIQHLHGMGYVLTQMPSKPAHTD